MSPPRSLFTTWKPLVFVYVGLAIFSIAVTLVGLSWQQEPRRDDLDRLVGRLGRPDYDHNSEDETPRPFIVTRMVTYERARVRAAYYRNKDDGTWHLIGHLDSATDSKISAQLAFERLTQTSPPPAIR